MTPMVKDVVFWIGCTIIGILCGLIFIYTSSVLTMMICAMSFVSLLFVTLYVWLDS